MKRLNTSQLTAADEKLSNNRAYNLLIDATVASHTNCMEYCDALKTVGRKRINKVVIEALKEHV